MTKEIILELRKKIVEARYKGQGYIAISKQFTVSRNAVCCIIAKYKETNSVRNKPGRGRKHKISRTLERKIVKDVSKEPRTSASGVDVSRNTHRPRISPLLKEQHIVARLRFAHEHLKDKDEFWYCCLCLAKKGTGLQPQEHSWEHHAVRLFWRLGHRKNYVDILKENLQKSAHSLGLGHRWVFQQDNDPKHASKLQLEQFETCANLVKTYSKRLLSVVAQKGYSIDY
uniref:Sleeping Beauty transposase HTH domain-containing protein n=1 Tax=Haplochromis burtoni TaxID=8153 RepID=A0A3Q2VWR3_HAPBU